MIYDARMIYDVLKDSHLHITPTTTATAGDVFALRAKATDVQEVDYGRQEVPMRDIPVAALMPARVQVIRVDGVQSTRAGVLEVLTAVRGKVVPSRAADKTKPDIRASRGAV